MRRRMFTTLLFGLCAMVISFPQAPWAAVHIGEIAAGRCIPRGIITDTDGQETVPIKIGAGVPHRFKVAIEANHATVTVDGHEFIVPRSRSL
jgi:hypothetical protein